MQIEQAGDASKQLTLSRCRSDAATDQTPGGPRGDHNAIRAVDKPSLLSNSSADSINLAFAKPNRPGLLFIDEFERIMSR